MYNLYRLIFIIFACVQLYLVIFNWDWLSKHQRRKFFGLDKWIEDRWGDKGVRILVGVFTIIWLTAVMFFLKR